MSVYILTIVGNPNQGFTLAGKGPEYAFYEWSSTGIYRKVFETEVDAEEFLTEVVFDSITQTSGE